MHTRKGVPTGYHHIWGYHGRWDEKKIKKGLWKFNFTATKGKKGTRKYGSFGKGTKGAWKINAIQYIEKTSPTSYQTKMIGYKKPLRFFVKKSSYSHKPKGFGREPYRRALKRWS